MTRRDQRQQIAIAIYPKCIETVEKILMRGQSCGESSAQLAASKMAIRYAEALLDELDNYSNLTTAQRANY